MLSNRAEARLGDAALDEKTLYYSNRVEAWSIGSCE